MNTTTILLVDDSEAGGKNIRDAIEPSGYFIDWVRKDYWTHACKEVAAKLQEKDWDILILDIHYPTDKYGGIWLYNELVRLELQKKWRHTIIYSQFVPNDWEQITREEEILIQVFLDTAAIDRSNALSNRTFNRSILVDRCKELLTS